MSETARALGMPGEIEWPPASGRILKVSRIHFGIEAKFELWLESNRDAALERSRSRMSAEAYRDRVQAANTQDGIRAFAWSGDAALQAAWGAVGFRHLSYLCIHDLQPSWSYEEHDALLADAAKSAELVGIIHRVSAPHPNGSGPGPQPGASSSPSPSSSPSSSGASAPTTS